MRVGRLRLVPGRHGDYLINCFIDILDNMRYRYYIQIINKTLSIKYNIGISNVTQESILTHMSLSTTTYMSIYITFI